MVLVIEFCYLGDMLSVDSDRNAAVTARIRSASASLFTAKDVPLLLWGKIYDAYVQSCMSQRNETWSLKTEEKLAFHWAENT